MGTSKSTNTARRFERTIRRATGTGNLATLRCIACLASDHGLGAVLVRAEAAERFAGGRHGR